MGCYKLIASRGFCGHICFHLNFRNERCVTNMVASWKLSLEQFLQVDSSSTEDHQLPALRVWFSDLTQCCLEDCHFNPEDEANMSL
jgi:hypothetical protein